MDIQQIYFDKITEAYKRLNASVYYLDGFDKSGAIIDLESAVLQLRKALECIVYSSVAPNVAKYKEFRSKSNGNKDFTKDFNGSKILKALNAINKDFYPITYGHPYRGEDGLVHFPQRKNPFPRNKFEKLYDRLGKFLHADNPWGDDKGYQNLAQALPDEIDAIKDMLGFYLTVVRTHDFQGMWIVEISPETGVPVMHVGQADGEFVVNIES
ncbi:hypothetical protein [Photobacterium leiognathi]|uniref:hypothetical protein n=1 Tax=Photobacterium leiognathi TaxID=553611 RepID=UPI0029818184|nr:hypothetical protein [Photobacterium leiognathi]